MTEVDRTGHEANDFVVVADVGAEETTRHRVDRGDSRLLHLASRFGLLAALAVIVAVFALVKPDAFLSVGNLQSTAVIAAPLLILAAGLTVPLSMGEFDLAITNSAQLSAAVLVTLISVFSVSWVSALGVTIVGAAIVGGFIGYVIVKSHVNAFIITLGAGTIMAGVEFAVANGATIFENLPPSFTDLGTQKILGIPIPVLIAVTFAVLVYLVMERTVAGRRMRAIGGSAEAARLSGVRVGQLRGVGFVATGVAGALAALLITAQAGSYFPNAIISQLLPAYAACFLGTTVFRSNIFDIGGTIVGVVFLSVIQDGLIIIGVPSWTAQIVEGALLIIAVVGAKLASRSLT